MHSFSEEQINYRISTLFYYSTRVSKRQRQSEAKPNQKTRVILI